VVLPTIIRAMLKCFSWKHFMLLRWWLRSVGLLFKNVEYRTYMCKCPLLHLVKGQQYTCSCYSNANVFVHLICLIVYCLTSIWRLLVTITGDRAENLDLCLAFMAFSSEGSFTCNTYCHTRPRYIRSHPDDRHPRPTEGFEPAT
jgi:hypothetical protein